MRHKLAMEEKYWWGEIEWDTAWGPVPTWPDCVWTDLEEWEKTECGCTKCWKRMKCVNCAPCKTCQKNRYYNKFIESSDGRCYKEEAREAELQKRAKERYGSPEFKPATAEQMAEWASWLTAPGAEAAMERIREEEEAAKARFDNVKFDPVEMERFLMTWVPKKDHDHYVKTNPKWVAFRSFGTEQTRLVKAYLSSLNIKTTEDYDKAKKAYGALRSHVDKHGEIISNIPESVHKAPVEAVKAKKGKRALKKEREESE